MGRFGDPGGRGHRPPGRGDRQARARSCAATTAGGRRWTRSCTTRLDPEQGRPGAQRLRQPGGAGGAARAGRGDGLDLLPRVPGRDGDLLRAGHDLGRRRHRRALRPRRRARRPLWAACAASTPTRRGRAGCSSPSAKVAATSGANTTRAVQDGDEWLLFGREALLLERRRRGVHRPGPARRGAGGQPGPRHLHRPAPAPRRERQRFRIKRLKSKLGHGGSAHGRGDPRRRPGVAGRRAGRTRRRRRRPGTDAARDGRGINRMMEMVNGSRFGVALMGLGIHRRSFLEAAIYAARRSQFGNRIDSYPLVRETLVDMLVDLEAGHGRHLRVRGGGARRPGPRVGPAGQAHPGTAGQDALHARWRCGRRQRASRCSAATGTWRTGPWRASCATRSATPSGRAPRTSSASTCGAPCVASTPMWPCWRASSAALESRPGHKVLAGAARHGGRALVDARTAVPYLEGAPDDMALLHSRRFAELLADTVRGRPARRGSGVGAASATAMPAKRPWHGAS